MPRFHYILVLWTIFLGLMNTSHAQSDSPTHGENEGEACDGDPAPPYCREATAHKSICVDGEWRRAMRECLNGCDDEGRACKNISIFS